MKECIDCKKMVEQWFTSYNDRRPRCDACATAEYKRINPRWDMKTLKYPASAFIYIGP